MPKSTNIYIYINKQVNLIYFDNAKDIHELSYFCTFDAVDAVNNICSTY